MLLFFKTLKVKKTEIIYTIHLIKSNHIALSLQKVFTTKIYLRLFG